MENCRSVYPVRGSVLVTKLPVFEHTGIYIGNGEVVELSSSGIVQKVSLEKFKRKSPVILVACDSWAIPVGDEAIAIRAADSIGTLRGYHVVHNNCHQFTAYCVNGRNYNGCNLFNKLEQEIIRTLQPAGGLHWLPMLL